MLPTQSFDQATQYFGRKINVEFDAKDSVEFQRQFDKFLSFKISYEKI